MSGEQFMHIQRYIDDGFTMYEDDLADVAELFDTSPMTANPVDLEDVARRFDEMEADEQAVHMFEDMAKEDFDELADTLQRNVYSNEYPAPDRVRGPSGEVAGDQSVIN